MPIARLECAHQTTYRPANTDPVVGESVAFPLSKITRAAPALVTRALCRFWPDVIARILYRRRASFWYKSSQSEHAQRIWGYTNRHSIKPGEGFKLMLSAGPNLGRVVGRVEIFRVGYQPDGGGDRERAWRGERIEVDGYRINNTAASLGPNWPEALTVNGTDGWRTGYHSIDFVHDDGVRDRDIAFIVATAPSRPADVLVKLATATYQAYNRWGGHSLYPDESPSVFEGRGLSLFESDVFANQGSMVSFDRPTPSEFWEWEYHFVMWLEKLAQERGFSVAYTTNFDIATKDVASAPRLLISVGHDEYWAKDEFDRHYERIFTHGGNTLFLGSNTAYRQVRYVDVNAPDHSRGRQLVCYKSMIDPIRDCVDNDPELHATARFRDGARCPENMLVGIAYQSNLPYRRQLEPRFAYRVANIDLPLFRDTGYEVGDRVADIIGHEWDNRDPEVERSAPGDVRIEEPRMWSAKRSSIAAIPIDKIHVVFTADPMDVLGHQGHAEAVYYESDAGAKVFSSGTNRWTWALNKEGYIEPQFRKFNENLILDFLEH